MAAHTNNFIRVRLHFDYPSPAAVDSRRCWLLVDLSACRVVADLESVIREKFEFGRGSILSLFVEDCYLPHTESALVVRDNDIVRVKVDCRDQPDALGCEDAPAESCRKRARPAEESGPGENGVSKKKKKKKKKKRAEESVETGQASGDERSETTQQKKKKKKKKREEEEEEEEEPAAPKAAASPKKPTVKIPQKPPVLRSKPQKAPSSDSSGEEDEAPKRPAAQKPAPTMPSSKAPPTSKPAPAKARPPPSPSSSETSGDEAAVVKPTAPGGGASAPRLKAAKGSGQRQSESPDSEEEIRLVIRRPAPPPGLVAGGGGGGGGGSLPWRGRGRGQGGRGGRGEEMGRGADRGGVRGRGVSSGGRGIGGGVGGGVGGGGVGGVGGGGGGGAAFGFNYDRAVEPSCRTDTLTNMSVVLQSGAADGAPRDYSAMPLLAAPPQVGQKIAFKLLELTENYTPEVSEYKEGKIVSFDLTTKQIELLVLNSSRAPVEPGKFDLVYQNADGSESVEYAVSRGSRVTERWDSLLEPRLVL